MPPCLAMWPRAWSRYLLRKPVPMSQGWKFNTSIRPVCAPSAVDYVEGVHNHLGVGVDVDAAVPVAANVDEGEVDGEGVEVAGGVFMG